MVGHIGGRRATVQHWGLSFKVKVHGVKYGVCGCVCWWVGGCVGVWVCVSDCCGTFYSKTVNAMTSIFGGLV